MTGTIKFVPAEMDTAAEKLRVVEKELSRAGHGLTDALTDGAPRKLAAQLSETLRGVRKELDTRAVSSGRQSETLKNRAALARLWDGSGTAKDMARLVALTTGKNPVDAKHNKLTFKLIEDIAGKYGTKPGKGDTGVTLQLAKWGKFWDKAKGLTDRKGINLPKSKLEAFMRGKGKWADLSKAVDAAEKASKPLKHGTDRKTTPKTVDHDDTATPEVPVTTPDPVAENPAPEPEPEPQPDPADDPEPTDPSAETTPPATTTLPAATPDTSSTTIVTAATTTTTTTTTTTDASGNTTTTSSTSRSPGSGD